MFADRLSSALDGGDVAAIQLRLKDCPDDEILRAIDTLRPIAQSREVAFLLNDRPDLAARTDCDGAHVGQDDTPYREARAILGPQAIIGVSCHNSRHLAMEAAEAGADYVAFGGFFPTETKKVEIIAEIETLAWWAEMMEVPCVAIGGITVQNAPLLIEAGADFLSVSGAIWNDPDGPAAAVAAFNRLF